jgi:hypothetical protein
VSIEWINVETRLPEKRRRVLAWGRYYALGMIGRSEGLIGPTKFNPSSTTGGSFDVEASGHFGFYRVTHWAEINGPNAEPDIPQHT